jgi:hypothetical protein
LACGTDDVAEPLPLEVVDLGSYAIHDTGGYTGPVAVEVPEGAGSVMAWCGNWGDATLGALWFLDSPSGTRVHDGDNPKPSFRADFLDDMAPALVPLAPGLDLATGAWNFDWFVGVGHSGSVDCGAVIRPDEPGEAALVSVDIVLVGLEGVDAASAEDNADLQAVLAHFEAEWASAGLTPAYTFKDFGGDVNTYAVVDVTDDDYAEFNDLLRTAQPADDRAMTFFLVSEIANGSADGATILGLSAGPPGAAAVQGTSKSGVVISAVDYDSTPERVAKIMAHEGGHFLGLYHTSEKAGDQHDPLDDTPQCPAGNDGDGSGSLSIGECGGAGADNVMFWTLTEGTASLSADQGWVLRHNPVAR